MLRFLLIALAAISLAPALSGCLASRVVGTAVSTTGAVVGGAARAGGAAVDAVAPGDKEDD